MPLNEIFSQSFEDYKKNWKIVFKGYFWLNALPYLIMMVILFGMLFFLIDTIASSFSSLVTDGAITDTTVLHSLTGNAISSGEMQLVKILLPVIILLVLFFVVYFILTFMLNLAIYYASLNNEKGKLTFKDIFRGGIRYFWRVLGLYVIIFLIFFLVVILGGIILILITALLSALVPLFLKVILVLISVVVGIFAVLFAIYLGVSWLLAPYIIIKENRGIFNSLTRSRELVKRRWWLTFGYFLLISIILGLISYSIGAFSRRFNILFGTMMGSSITSQNYSAIVVLLFFSFVISYIFQLVARVLTFPYSVFFFKNIYYEYSGIGSGKTQDRKEERKKTAKVKKT